MTSQWQPVDPPFKDPSNPDIGIETELWKGGPRPQAEVQYGTKGLNDPDFLLNGKAYVVGGPMTSSVSPDLGTWTSGLPTTLTAPTDPCPVCNVTGKKQEWCYSTERLVWTCCECGIVYAKQVDDDINRLMPPMPDALKYLSMDNLSAGAAINRQMRLSREHRAEYGDFISSLGAGLVHNGVGSNKTLVMDFSPRYYQIGSYLSLGIHEPWTTREWIADRIATFAVWLQVLADKIEGVEP